MMTFQPQSRVADLRNYFGSDVPLDWVRDCMFEDRKHPLPARLVASTSRAVSLRRAYVRAAGVVSAIFREMNALRRAGQASSEDMTFLRGQLAQANRDKATARRKLDKAG